MKKGIIFIIIIAAILAGVFSYRNKINKIFFRASQPAGEIGVVQEQVEVADIEVVAENLKIPWEIAFLPSGEMLVTERPGNLLKIGTDKTVIKIQGVEHVGEGGLQGMALHPDFENNNWIYLYSTTKINNELTNRVERYVLKGNRLSSKNTILKNIPGAKYHDGGRIEFGPDNKLYITTGDATKSDKAQDLDYLGGKILRINDDGSIPEDNPFGTAVYSYGHRNPQGLAWGELDTLWSTEHGRSGIKSGLDELNIIMPGKNYGWPDIEGDEEAAGVVEPLIHSGPDITWAPAGMIYLNKSIFFAGLRGEALYEYKVQTREIKTHFFGDFGRLRAVVLHDGFIYISTSNTDGRGDIQDGDDKVIKINPKIFE